MENYKKQDGGIMQEFSIIPKICILDSCDEFVKNFDINENDLIITTRFLYDRYFMKKIEKSTVIFQEEYGLGEPTDEMIEKMYFSIKDCKYKRVIAIGGGTVIDIAKLFVLDKIVPVADLFSDALPIEKTKELIIVPSTCGTGSEVTNISIVNLLSVGSKKGLAVPELFAEKAILISELVAELPVFVFATSSIDALIHAIEAMLSPKASVYSDIFAKEAIRRIISSYEEIKREGIEERSKYVKDILIASNMAGIAFGNAGCGTIHAMSYPLGGKYHVAHGESNYAMFLGVMRYYYTQNPDGKIEELNDLLSSLLHCDVEELYFQLEELLNFFISRKPLEKYGVLEEELEEFTDLVMNQQQRLMKNSYVPLSREDIYKIYQSVYSV